VPRSEALAASILRAAEQIFGAHGFAQAEMRAIAQRAGVAVGTLYNYFPNKQTLFARVCAAVAQRLVETVATVRADPARDWEERLLGILEAQMHCVAGSGAIWTALEAERDGLLSWLTAQVIAVLQESGRGCWQDGQRCRQQAVALVAAAAALVGRTRSVTAAEQVG